MKTRKSCQMKACEKQRKIEEPIQRKMDRKRMNNMEEDL